MLKLISLFLSAIPALFSAFFAYFLRKHSTAVAGLLAVAAMLVIFVACINSILNSILPMLAIPGWLLSGISMFIPGNFGVVLAAMVSARICRAAYDFALLKTDIVVKAN